MATVPSFSLRDPAWLAHRHEEAADALRFIHIPRDHRSQVPFLTDAYLGDRPGPVVIPIKDCLAQFQPPTIGWLFHSAFCGSTMLARAFDCPGIASSLSEPMVLNDVVGLRRRGGDPRAVARLADAAMRMLGRPFAEDSTVIVKPSNVLNPLAELLLALHPAAPAILLFAPVETFLISVVRKGLPCRLWVRELLEGYLSDDFVNLGFTHNDYFRMSDLQVAAVGWLSQHALFARLATKFGPDRIRTLDADLMLAAPEQAIAQTALHWGIGLGPGMASSIASGSAFSRHSKSGELFSAKKRTREYAAVREAYGAEIDLVLTWLARVAEGAGVPLALPHPIVLQAS